ncbi:TrbI/VirB10 family protein [uncultured Halopseudomonas sp.]|uniref:TrbI/VirB10 family protein n=1 Tax=uncultured Halopseudomonas sp. TaxID=2901193 RepID=UPI0005F19CF2|nr:MAG: conjugal transfer protein TrbI [Gammaproteobacteria bacterium BRH_c0]|tara:strand:+ start:31227 stop:32513 length:1287 start_codon:yes stop_codon:yes gene_type:complete
MDDDNTPDQPQSKPSPKLAPEQVALRAQPRPVTRLNRRMLAVLAGGVATAMLGAMFWSLRTPERGAMHGADELYNVDRIARSEELTRLPADYSQLPPEVPRLGKPLPGDLGEPILKAERQAMGYRDGQDSAEVDRLARLKDAEEAAASSVFFGSIRPRSSTIASVAGGGEGLPTNQGLGALDSLAMLQNTSSVETGPIALQNRQEQKEAFLSNAGFTETRNSGDLQAPVSPYQVMAGTVIAAALVTGINSDLPGDVIATVTEPVYDTATGRHVLIPQGSRILGRYNSQVSYGQTRVQMVWHRVILPDTSSFQLDNLAGTDPAGYAGLEDGVDWHWDRLFAGAALTTLLGVGAELAAPENRQDGDRVIIAGRDSAQDSVNQIGQEVTRRNLNIQPTLTSRPGLPVRLIVNRDLVLRPYQPLIYQRGTTP